MEKTAAIEKFAGKWSILAKQYLRPESYASKMLSKTIRGVKIPITPNIPKSLPGALVATAKDAKSKLVRLLQSP